MNYYDAEEGEKKKTYSKKKKVFKNDPSKVFNLPIPFDSLVGKLKDENKNE